MLQLLLRLDHPHGPGDTFISWQHGSGGFFATTGVDQSVVIYDHHGRKVEHIPLQGYDLHLAQENRFCLRQ
jgi:hypothetical protein